MGSCNLNLFRSVPAYVNKHFLPQASRNIFQTSGHAIIFLFHQSTSSCHNILLPGQLMLSFEMRKADFGIVSRHTKIRNVMELAKNEMLRFSDPSQKSSQIYFVTSCSAFYNSNGLTYVHFSSQTHKLLIGLFRWDIGYS